MVRVVRVSLGIHPTRLHGSLDFLALHRAQRVRVAIFTFREALSFHHLAGKMSLALPRLLDLPGVDLVTPLPRL